MRKLATIRQIAEVLPIEGADAIVLVKIDGWQCVALKEEFKAGDHCVYFEIDSFIPITPAVEHLRFRAMKKIGDKEGIRIKTIKLRGQLSQGLALPWKKFPEIEQKLAQLYDERNVNDLDRSMTEYIQSTDWDEVLGVVKYELPIPSELGGQVRGNFPASVPKTDQERCQNLVGPIFYDNVDSRYEVTMKLDGTSFTAFRIDEQDGVCGRNWEQVVDANNPNKLVRMYMDSGLQTALRELRLNFAVQGELMGPGIQQNREGLKNHKLFVFDIHDIDNKRYLTPQERHKVMVELWNCGMNRDMVEHVPVMTMDATLSELGISNVQELLKFAEGPSIVHPMREGLVFKRTDGGFSFKAISNAFLLKEKD